MKILLVSHAFPPHGSAGTETYTANLAAALAKRGHAVAVIAARKDVSLSDLEWTERKVGELVVHELVNNLFHDDFRQTWDHPLIAQRFAERLERIAPELVHFQHLLYLSVGCLEAASMRSLPVLFTLHDFWLQCPRFGQRLHVDGGLCDEIVYERCGTCLSRFKWAQSPLERRLGGALSSLRGFSGIDLAPLARTARAMLERGRGAGQAEARPEVSQAFALAAAERSRELARRVLPCVQRFFAPSRFLRERFVREWGVPPEQIEHLPFGAELDLFPSTPRRRAGRLRVRFLGSLIPAKGPDLLLEAWALVEPALRERGELVLFGPARGDERFVAALERQARALGATLAGELDRAGVARELARTDLLVVPSRWWENSPLVIHEALAARVPLLVAGAGGMAELVLPGVSGWHFRLGDREDLARALRSVLEEPAALDRLYATPARLMSFDEHVAALEQRYQEALTARR